MLKLKEGDGGGFSSLAPHYRLSFSPWRDPDVKNMLGQNPAGISEKHKRKGVEQLGVARQHYEAPGTYTLFAIKNQASERLFFISPPGARPLPSRPACHASARAAARC